MARRDYGTGSVYQRKSDGRWVGTLEAGWTADGDRRRLYVVRKTKPQALSALRDKRLQIEREGNPGQGASARTTVRQWAAKWLELVVDDLRPETYTSNRSAVNQWIVPVVGHKRLDQLAPNDIRAVAKAQQKAGRSSSTALRTHAVLMLALKAAVVEGHFVPPRVMSMPRPPVGVSDRDALTVEQAIACLDVASTLTDGSRWVAALLQGMRQGECLGLTWDAVQDDLLDISWQLATLPYIDRRQKALGFRVPRNYEARPLEGAWHLVRPKTARGQRSIPVVPWMRTALDTWREQAPESPHGLVWPRLDGRPADDRQDREEWHALQCTAAVGHPGGRWFHLHEARNTTATLLLEAGVDPEVIKAVLGHSSIVTSRAYMRVSEDMARQAMERVADRLRLTQ